MNHSSSHLNSEFGFTIVELLVVIVVIGILAAITIVSYTGVTKKANETVLISDLSNNANKLGLYQAIYGSYPTTPLGPNNCPSQPHTDDSYCLKASNGGSLSYSSNGSTFTLAETAADATTKYQVTDSLAPTVYSDPWTNWYAGTGVLAGKHVYKTDVGQLQYKTSNTAVASPQGTTGLDAPNYTSSMSLVADNSVDFSAYPARDACKTIGGRLPTMTELLAIYAGHAITYGSNFQTNGYWSSTEYNITGARTVYFGDGSIFSNVGKGGLYYVRCISG